MATAVCQPLGGWRNESCSIPITMPGFNPIGHAFRMQVRLAPDTPGAALLDIGQTSDTTALGIRVLPLTVDEQGIPTTHLVLQVPKASMQGLPYMGEVGDPTALSYAFQIDGVTRLYGDFLALASPIDSDAAPANRPAGYVATPSAAQTIAGVILTIGDAGVTVSVNGIDLLAPLIAAATVSAQQVAAKLDARGFTMQGAADFAGNPVHNVPDPQGDLDGSNKRYVDTTAPTFAAAHEWAHLGDYGNLHNVDTAIMDTAISGNTGGSFAAAGNFITGFMPVMPGQSLLFNLPAHSYAFYDRGLTYISGFESSGTSAPAGTPVSVPARAFWARAFFGTGDLRNLYVTTASAIPILIRQFRSRSRWHGKRVGWLSDSQLARNAGYVTQLAACADLGAIDVPFTNDCISGRRWADCLPSGANPALTAGAIGALDVLIILLGANNWDVPDKMPGTYTDAAGAATTAGDIRAVYEQCYALNPGLRIITLLPNKRGVIPGQSNKSYKTANTYGWTLEQYVNLIASIAADYGAQRIDLFRDLPFTDLTFGRYSNDNVHLNYAVGQPMLADFLTARLRAA